MCMKLIKLNVYMKYNSYLFFPFFWGGGHQMHVIYCQSFKFIKKDNYAKFHFWKVECSTLLVRKAWISSHWLLNQLYVLGNQHLNFLTYLFTKISFHKKVQMYSKFKTMFCSQDTLLSNEVLQDDSNQCFHSALLSVIH